VVVVELQG
jgi:hypothetical protein